MRKKQKYFSVLDEKGNLTNYFIGIRNGVSQNQDVVREGYERVLAARLSDAEFFFHQDTKTPLSSKVDKLKGVIFQQKLGTMYDKMIRVKQLALYINILLKNNAGFNVQPADIEKACELSKADLVTEMVFEYPGITRHGRPYVCQKGRGIQ